MRDFNFLKRDVLLQFFQVNLAVFDYNAFLFEWQFDVHTQFAHTHLFHHYLKDIFHAGYLKL